VFDCNFTYICVPTQHNGDGSPETVFPHHLNSLCPGVIRPFIKICNCNVH